MMVVGAFEYIGSRRRLVDFMVTKVVEGLLILSFNR